MVLPHSQQNTQPSGPEKNRDISSETILAVLSKIIDPDRGRRYCQFGDGIGAGRQTRPCAMRDRD